MIIRETNDIQINTGLWNYLNSNNIEYTAHTFYKGNTVYKIFTDNEEHLKNIDKITGGENNCWVDITNKNHD